MTQTRVKDQILALALALRKEDPEAALQRYQDILDQIPDRESEVGDPVEIRVIERSEPSTEEVDLRIEINEQVATSMRWPDQGATSVDCDHVPTHVAAVVAKPRDLINHLLRTVLEKAATDELTEKALLTAARFVTIPAGTEEMRRLQILTPHIRSKWPEAAENFESRVETATARGLMNRAHGMYLRNNDALLQGSTPASCIEHLCGTTITGLLRRHLEMRRADQAIKLVEGGLPASAAHLRVARENPDQRPRTSETEIHVGVGTTDEPTEETKQEYRVQLDEEARADDARTPSALSLNEAAPMMRPREIFTTLWQKLEKTLESEPKPSNRFAALLLRLLAEWMILPDAAGKNDPEPVFWEPPGMAPSDPSSVSRKCETVTRSNATEPCGWPTGKHATAGSSCNTA